MIAIHPFRSRALAAFLLAVLVVAAPAAVAGQEKVKNATVVGRVFLKDMVTPVQGAVVKLRHLKTGRVHEAQPTDVDGMYSHYEVPPGRYAVGVTREGDDFNLNYTLELKAGDSGTLSLCLDPSRRMALRDCSERSFFQKNGAGMLVLAIVAGAGVYTLAQPEEEASPIR